MTRLVKGRPPGREFDIAFWQKLGPPRIPEAASWNAAGVHTAPRYTKDLDGWSTPTRRMRAILSVPAWVRRPQDRTDVRRLERPN